MLLTRNETVARDASEWILQRRAIRQRCRAHDVLYRLGGSHQRKSTHKPRAGLHQRVSVASGSDFEALREQTH